MNTQKLIQLTTAALLLVGVFISGQALREIGEEDAHVADLAERVSAHRQRQPD